MEFRDYLQKLAKHYEFCSTQVELTGGGRQMVLDFAKNIIDAEDLSEKGFENTPHITVKYGIHVKDKSRMQEVVSATHPVSATIGEVGVFQAQGRSYDVVYLKIHSDSLRSLHRAIVDKFKFNHTDTYPTYTPHMTLAYVKAGTGKKYAGKVSPVTGKLVVFDELVFSGKRNGRSVFPFASGQKTAAEKKSAVICVDLDGTLLEYDGWKGEEHFGKPLPKAVKAMQTLKDLGHTIIIFTVRANRDLIAKKLQAFGIPYDHVNENPEQPGEHSGKPLADIYIDDRAIRFRNWGQALTETLQVLEKHAMLRSVAPRETVVLRVLAANFRENLLYV